jgi:transcriptional regulator with XRE-family HTH domain
LRLLAGVSARDASSLAGLSPSHVGLLESDRHVANVDTASRLARIFGASIDWLVDGTGRPPSPRTVRGAVAAARERARTVA